jgi:hypothetical protein
VSGAPARLRRHQFFAPGKWRIPVLAHSQSIAWGLFKREHLVSHNPKAMPGKFECSVQSVQRRSLMRKAIVASLLLVSSAIPAFALPQADCEKSWNAFDINHDGLLRGEEAKRFVDDMAGKGVVVYSNKSGEIGAKQYNAACIADFWAKDAPQ